MSFGGLILTNKGRNLQVKAQTGVVLNYTKVKIGDGEIGTGSILDMNDLNNPLHTLDISNLKRIDNQATIRTIITNNELQEGFYFREIGVFANDPDEGEILYCYANARSNAEYIPAAGTDIIEKNIDIVVIVGQAENVTASIDESLIFASKRDISNAMDNLNNKITNGLNDFIQVSISEPTSYNANTLWLQDVGDSDFSPGGGGINIANAQTSNQPPNNNDYWFKPI